MEKTYNRINFQNSPTKTTPLSAANLNQMDKAIDELDNRSVDADGKIKELKGRMDAFTSLGEGSTTGDAELTDGRVDYKGDTHTNIGEHIREVSRQFSSEIGNFYSSLEQHDNGIVKTNINITWEQGYYSHVSNVISKTDSPSWGRSESFIDLKDDTTLVIEPLNDYQCAVILVDNTDGTYTTKDSSTYALSTEKKEITLNGNLKYLVIQCKNPDKTNFSYDELYDNILIYEISKTETQKQIDELKNDVSFVSLGFSKNNFMKSSKTPLITWIDDDTDWKISNVKSICDELGIKCSFACKVTYIDEESELFRDGLEELLKEYQSNGFHITSHSYAHSSIWSDTSDDYDISSCESDLIKSLEILKAKGFLQSDYIVTPYGANNDDVRSMCSKWCKGLVNAYFTTEMASKRYNHLAQNGRYNINRWFIDKSNYTLEDYTLAIDYIYENGDWLILGTHSAIDDEWDNDLVKNVFQYAIDKGIEILPLNQAFKKREQIYNIYDMFQ